MSTRTRLREIIAGSGLSVWPGAYDAMSARLIERAGFDAVCAGGYAGIGSMLAEADMGQSNVRDYADHYARICEAVSVPVYVDADTGFGGLHNITKMVRAFESAGVAGLFLSDQVFPNRCGYLPGKEIVPAEQLVARMSAALDARRDEGLVIVARTDIYQIEGLDAAIERCQLCMEAGCDAAKPQGVDVASEIRRVVDEVPGPHIATISQAAGKPKTTFAELDAIGVAAVTLPSVTLFSAAEAVRRVLEVIQMDSSLENVEGLMALEEYYDVVGLAGTLDREERYDRGASKIVEAHASR
jgi:methylisocitrate lyase